MIRFGSSRVHLLGCLALWLLATPGCGDQKPTTPDKEATSDGVRSGTTLIGEEGAGGEDIEPASEDVEVPPAP